LRNARLRDIVASNSRDGSRSVLSGVPQIAVCAGFLIHPIKWYPCAKQVSGHEFTRAVQPKKNPGFSPCRKTPQGLKANSSMPFTARLKSCPDTCLAAKSKKVPSKDTHHPAFLRVSAPPRWRYSR
jgi:hypothetical protein